jgi:hypothetical protein
VNPDSMILNGYSAVQVRDVRKVAQLAEEHEGFMVTALRARGVRPKPQVRVALKTTRGLLETSARYFPLIAIHEEKKDLEVCWIGRPNPHEHHNLFRPVWPGPGDRGGGSGTVRNEPPTPGSVRLPRCARRSSSRLVGVGLLRGLRRTATGVLGIGDNRVYVPRDSVVEAPAVSAVRPEGEPASRPRTFVCQKSECHSPGR